MYFINNLVTDPYFNLATEEYLLKNFQEEFCMLWQNDPVIVIGKHQNALSEINYSFVKNTNIKVARRISGGGTVYHDPGNLNFTFITNGEPGRLVDYKKQITPVIKALRAMDIPAEQGPKNEILVKGMKISGNAEHIYKNRVLHHGTLLISSDLKLLDKVLKVTPGRYTDKPVRSNRSKVMNIKDILKPGINPNIFRSIIYKYLKKLSPSPQEYNFSEEDIEKIQLLKEDKFATWQWIFGYSPDYSLKSEVVVNNITESFELSVEKGYIREIKFNTISIPSVLQDLIATNLAGMPHNENLISKKMDNIKAKLSVAGIEKDAFIQALF